MATPARQVVVVMGENVGRTLSLSPPPYLGYHCVTEKCPSVIPGTNESRKTNMNDVNASPIASTASEAQQSLSRIKEGSQVGYYCCTRFDSWARLRVNTYYSFVSRMLRVYEATSKCVFSCVQSGSERRKHEILPGGFTIMRLYFDPVHLENHGDGSCPEPSAIRTLG